MTTLMAWPKLSSVNALVTIDPSNDHFRHFPEWMTRDENTDSTHKAVHGLISRNGLMSRPSHFSSRPPLIISLFLNF